MKILMIIPSLGAGGAERVLSSLANDWAINKECKLEIALLTDTPDFYEIDDRIKVHRLNYKGGSANKIIKIIKIIKLVSELKSLINFTSPDVCLSFTRESNIITLLSSFGSSTKVFISERDSPFAEVSQMYSSLRKKLYPYANGLIVQTHDYKKFALNELGTKRVEVIPNPVRNINCRNIEKENIIINVGRLITQKGQLYLLESFALCERRDGWKLAIIGDGILKDILIKKAEELDIIEHVIFVGNTKNVDQWLCRSSIFAFTSITEGFPNALLEAMSASLPCVSFNCITGPKELIDDGLNGYLVDVGDTITFSKKLDALISSEHNRSEIGLNAKTTTKDYALNIISEQYFSFICN